jgi:hypothetical protein
MNRNRRPLTLEQLEPRTLPSVSILTYHDDAASTGQNLSETVLGPSNVNATSFGKLGSLSVDGQVYAQPLYVAGLTLNTITKSTANVVYVATENDSVYAFVAAGNHRLWKDSFINPAAGVTTVPSTDVNSTDLTPQIGITSTPVIDPTTNTLYVVAKTKEIVGSNHHYVQRLHALDLVTGAEKFGGPVVIADTISNDLVNYTYVSGPTVAGTGDGNVGGVITYNALRQNQRSALVLLDGVVYFAASSHGDNPPYHGWILGYNAQTLQVATVFNDTPNGSDGGIWEGGGKLASDSQGHFYLETGNGTFDTTFNSNGFPSLGDYGDTFLKLAPDGSTMNNPNINGWGLGVVDYFTPFNQASLSKFDLDLGSGGPVVLPDSVGSTSHPHLLVGAGKQGRIYLVDRDNMGKFNPNKDQIVQELNLAMPSGSFDTAGYFNGGLFYVGVNDNGKAYTIANGAISTQPVAKTHDAFGFPGSTPSISANGATNGIVWDVDAASSQLRAYDATNYGSELYTSAQAGQNRDQLGPAVKFSVPVVANGLVIVGTKNALVVYGLLGASAQKPAAAAAIAVTADLTARELPKPQRQTASAASIALPAPNDEGMGIEEYPQATGPTPGPAGDPRFEGHTQQLQDLFFQVWPLNGLLPLVFE